MFYQLVFSLFALGVAINSYGLTNTSLANQNLAANSTSIVSSIPNSPFLFQASPGQKQFQTHYFPKSESRMGLGIKKGLMISQRK